MVVFTCLLCGTQLNAPDGVQAMGMYECPRCGPILLGTGSFLVFNQLATDGGFDPRKDAARADAVSHKVRQWAGSSGKPVFIASDQIRTLLQEARISPPSDQANNLVLYLGEQANDDPAKFTNIEPPPLASIVGSRSTPEAVHYLLQHAAAEGWIEQVRPPHPSYVRLRLTFAGWQRYEELQRAKVDGRRAFMAMQFNEATVKAAFDDCFKPAVSDAGFELRLVTDGQGAGLIDDHIRVAIRTSRFVVADLTNGNRGAYWEAGFAEGLGRPVIYVCREDVFNDRKHAHHPHFDTNHLNTVPWSPENLSEARQRLADTIRNTFPDEAKMA